MLKTFNFFFLNEFEDNLNKRQNKKESIRMTNLKHHAINSNIHQIMYNLNFKRKKLKLKQFRHEHLPND
jgi:hypothetical protein